MKKSTSTPSLLALGSQPNGMIRNISSPTLHSGGMIRNKSSPKLNALFNDSSVPITWDIPHAEESVMYVPLQQAVTCGSKHTFPLSLLESGEDDNQFGLATCLATPSTQGGDEGIEDQLHPRYILRRIVSLDALYRRRLLMYNLTKKRK